MKTLSRFILMAAVLLISFESVNAQTQTLAASEHWNEINSLTIVQERKAYIRKLNPEQRAALSIEHTNRKLESMNLTDEQRQALIDVRDSITVEFVTEAPKAPEGQSKNPAVVQVMKAIEQATKVLNAKQMFEIFCLYGDRETLSDPNNAGGC